jgi:glucosylglycerol-phosphate synthase
MASEFIVLSHREPYAEVETADGVELRRKTNGVFATLDSVMQERRGTWIAWSEREEGKPFAERLTVPSAGHPQAYEVRRIGLEPEEARRFYYDFTSSAIWPVLFSLLDRARFTREAWETYRRVNRLFAEAVCEEAAPGAIVWVNDFHLMLTPRMVKRRRPDITMALFLHTTFPPPDIFGVIPWRRELLDSLLHLDLIGFHIPSYALNFANTAERFLGAVPNSVVGTDLVEKGPAVSVSRYPLSLRYGDREVALGVYPVGVDVAFFGERAQRRETREKAAEIRERTGARKLILSAERLDYVKGALERLECFERFLARHPEWHGEVSFIQIAVPTRTGMEEFQEMRRQAEEAVGRINGRFGRLDWQPVMHFYTAFPREELVAFYAAADVLWVTPLRDGLNLVAKEYVATRVSSDGVVILSEFAGAAAELEGVVLTNPYSPDDMDRALEAALTMPEGERTARMMRLRERVLYHDVHRWSSVFLRDVGRVSTARHVVGSDAVL